MRGRCWVSSWRPSRRRCRRSGAANPESLVLLRILAELQFEVVTLLRLRRVTTGDRVGKQGVNVDDTRHLIAGTVVGPRGGVIGFLETAWLPAVDGVRTAAVSEVVAPQIDIGASQVGIHFMTRTGWLSNVVNPNIATVVVTVRIGADSWGLH